MAPNLAAARSLVDAYAGTGSAYWRRTAAARTVVAALGADGPPRWDHFAFRSFDAYGGGAAGLAAPFEALGWTRADDELDFPAKRLTAWWWAPPDPGLPRVFVSQLRVAELSDAAAAVVHEHADAARHLEPHAPLLGLAGALPWPPPTKAQYDLLAAESEYAAWTLVNGARLNHTTVAVHALPRVRTVEAANALVEAAGLTLNAVGGVVKVSPDGLLRQSSTAAAPEPFAFGCGAAGEVPGAYVELAERLVLPEHAAVPAAEREERHLRDGFEVGNADGIFESTSRSAK